MKGDRPRRARVRGSTGAITESERSILYPSMKTTTRHVGPLALAGRIQALAGRAYRNSIPEFWTSTSSPCSPATSST